MSAIWSNALQRLSAKITPNNFDMWLRPISCRKVEGQTLYLQAPNSYVRLWFESNYLDIVMDEMRELEDSTYEVQFMPEESPEDVAPGTATGAGTGLGADLGEDPGAGPETGSQAGTDTESTTSASVDVTADGTGIGTRGCQARKQTRGVFGRASTKTPFFNPRYTFANFIAGPSNQLAVAAAQAAARRVAAVDEPKYNPIFIFGAVGLGKTHLLHAIAHGYREQKTHAHIVYVSSEQFMNEYIHSIRMKEMPAFRQKYREDCDMLLIDDVQFLAGKDSTQEEFFHTFNTLHNQRRQIVLTSDRSPHEIRDIADRLRSRFAWGLMADVELPDIETRMRIVQRKANLDAIPLCDETAHFLASTVTSNIRELEGALVRVSAYASLMNEEITLAMAQQLLRDRVPAKRQSIDADEIISSVAEYFSLKKQDILSAKRHRAVSHARAVAMYLARTHTEASYPDLGRSFGGRHHSTVLAAVDKVNAKLASHDAFRSELAALEKRMGLAT